MIKHIGTISKEDFKSSLLVVLNRLQNIFGILLFTTPIIWLVFLNGWVKTKPAPPEVIHDYRKAICALVNEKGSPYCTGTLIMDNIILTAGHCLGGKEVGDNVYLNFTEVPGYNMIEAKISYNPYDVNIEIGKPNDDFAILKSNSDLNIKPIEIAIPSEIIEPFNPDVEIIGFPIIAAERQINQTKVSQSRMTNVISNYDLSDITVFLLQNETWRGNSGGPIIMNLENTGNDEDDNKLENKRIVGIVCWGAVDGQFEGQSFAEKTSQLIDNINIPEDIWENEINNDKVNLE